MEVINRNIVILPSAEVEAEAISRSKLAAKIGNGAFTLTDGEGDRRPHITVHQFALPADQEDKLVEIITAEASTLGQLHLHMKGYSLFAGTGIFWDVIKNDALFWLHQTLVHKVDLIRSDLIMDQHASFTTGTPDIGSFRRQSLLKFGNPLAIGTFWPHTTLTSAANSSLATAVVEELPDSPMAFTATHLHITEVGPSGTCPKILHSFQLGK